MPPAQASVVANQTSQAMIGGSYAYDGSWPFVVAIYYKGTVVLAPVVRQLLSGARTYQNNEHDLTEYPE